MPLTSGGSDGAFNGATPVEIVPAPPANVKRIVKEIIIDNKDSVSASVTVVFEHGTDEVALFTYPKSLAVGGVYTWHGSLVLSDTDHTVDGVLAGGHTTTAPRFKASYVDES